MRQVARSGDGAGIAPEGASVRAGSPSTPAPPPRSQVDSDRASHRRRRHAAMPAWLPPIE